MTRLGLATAALGTLGALTIARGALADLADDVTTLTNRFRAGGGGTIVTFPPRLLSSRDTLPLALPPSAVVGEGNGCTTVAVLGAVSTVFALRLPGEETASSPGELFPSVAGARMLVRCGATRRVLGELSLEMRSPRAVVETVVAESSQPPPELRMLLPHRDPGFIPPPPGPPGGAPYPGPLSPRAAALEETWTNEGAKTQPRRLVPTDESGGGRLVLDFQPGCHRLVILAVDPEVPNVPVRAHDIDAELAWVSGDVAAIDRTDSPDATLTACTGVRQLAIVAFAGGAPHGRVVLLEGVADLPRGVPEEWGRTARARIARALLDGRAPNPTTPPIYTSLGVAGLTVLPVEVVPGECYLAALAVVDGTAKLVALTVETSDVRSASHTDEPDAAAVVTFCAGASRRAKLETEVHGASLVSTLGLWPMGRRRLGEDAP